MDRDLFQRNEDLGTVRFLDTQRDRVHEFERKLDDAGFPGPALDQYPAKRRPALYPRMLGPAEMTCAGRLDETAVGFLSQAALANTAAYLAPVNPILIGREKLFYAHRISVACFVSWTYVSDPGFSAPIDAREPADLMDSVFGANGGASMLLNHSQAFDIAPDAAMQPTTIRPRVYFDLELYDRKRGRALSDGYMPGEMVLGGAFENKRMRGFLPKANRKGFRFDVDTEIEPRIYVRELRMSEALDTDVAFEAARVKVWFQVCFFGENAYALEPNGEWHELGTDKVGFDAPPRRF